MHSGWKAQAYTGIRRQMEDMQLVVQQESVNAAAESAADRLLALRGDEEEMQQNRCTLLIHQILSVA